MNVFVLKKNLIAGVFSILILMLLCCLFGTGKAYAAVTEKTITKCSDLNDAFSRVQANTEYIFKITKDITVNLGTDDSRVLDKAGAVVTIVASGGNRKITSDNLSPVFTVKKGTLNLQNSDSQFTLTIDGGSTTSRTNPAILVTSSSTVANGNSIVNMYDKTIIQNVTSTVTTKQIKGMGVQIIKGAYFNMYGGLIQNCGRAGSPIYGGAVYVSGQKSTFNMYGGEISGCKAYLGGGIYLNYTSNTNLPSVNIFDGTIKSCIGYYGGAIYSKGAPFNMTGGQLTLNQAYYAGGAIFNEGGAGIPTATIQYPAKITGNTANSVKSGEYGGGAIYNSNKAELTVAGAEITNNSTEKAAGGIFNNAAKTLITHYVDGDGVHPAVISGNTSTGSGGGIHNIGGFNGQPHATLEISGQVTIENNKSKNYGGGVSNYWDAEITINGATIRNNETEGQGGGIASTIYSKDVLTSVTILDATVEGNKANEGYGGAVYNTQTMTISGGTFTNNTARVGGGIYSGESSTISGATSSLTMSAGNVYGNTGTIEAADIFAMTPASLSLSDATNTGMKLDNKDIDGWYYDYINARWPDTTDKIQRSGAVITPVETKTYLALKAAYATGFTVKFDVNAPADAAISGTMEDQVIERDTDTALSANTFTDANGKYHFKEWNTKADGSGDSYSDKATVKNLADSEITLYAQWTSDMVITPPEPKSLIYNGAAQELVTPGATEHGTIYYATGTDTQPPEFDGTSDSPDKKWSTSIPTGTESGAYYIWYKGVGDAKHSDTEPACVRSDIAYSISYDPNGGIGGPTQQNKTEGGSVTITSEIPTRYDNGVYEVTYDPNGGTMIGMVTYAQHRTYYRFLGWNTERDGSGTSYAPGAAYTADEAVTLYAQWIRTGEATASIPLPTPKLEGHVFQGWATNTDLESGMTGRYKPTDKITLYAIWKIGTYTISFDTDGGTVIEPITGEYGMEITTVPEEPTKRGFVFKGWDKAIPAAMPGEDVVIKALFEPLPFGEADLRLREWLEVIEEEAFEGDTMKSVYLPDSVDFIGANAFKDCKQLEKIRLPRDCEIDETAFTGCSEELLIYAPAGGTVEEFCEALELAFVPDGGNTATGPHDGLIGSAEE